MQLVDQVSGFRRYLNGSMIEDIEKEYATWLTIPKKLLASDNEFGLGKDQILSRNFLQGLTPSMVTSKPANSTSGWPNWNLSGLKTRPAL